MYKRFYPPEDTSVSPKLEGEDAFPKKYPPITFDMQAFEEEKEAPEAHEPCAENNSFGSFKQDDLLLIALVLLLLGEDGKNSEALVPLLALLLLGFNG